MTDNMKLDKNILKFESRLGEFIAVFMIMVLAAFWLRHQRLDTGFFTDEFGTFETFLFYGSMFFAVLPPLVRGIMGRRNVSRPWDIWANMVGVLTAIWLLSAFPFNFNYLPDALPSSLQFLLEWVTNDIGKIPLILQIIFMPIATLVYLWQYITFGKPDLNEAIFQ